MAKMSEIFGVSDKRYEEICKEAQHFMIDSKTLTDLAESMGIADSGELGLKCAIWTQILVKNQNDYK